MLRGAVLILILGTAALPAMAAQPAAADRAAEGATESGTESESTPDRADPGSGATEPADDETATAAVEPVDTFKPTEAIDEDYSIAFPTDI